MSNQIDKQSGAMRIFEALSSVDEELLERSEGSAKVFPFRMVTRMMAACASLLVVGLVTWSGVQTFVGGDKAASDCAAPESMKEMSVADMTWPGEEAGNTAVTTDVGAQAEAEECIPEIDVEYAQVTKGEMDDVTTDGVVEENQNAMWDSGTALQQPQETLSEEKLRGVEKLGEYIPTVIPGGYAFESGYQTAEGGIHACWSKGMDSIMFFVSIYEETPETKERMAEVSRPETYDVHLYEIPYATTVPEEYRLVFSNPIFEEKDFSAEVVQARMKSVADAGDTETPRGNFEVLYESGVLVRFSGDGSPEQIWEMFESIGE